MAQGSRGWAAPAVRQRPLVSQPQAAINSTPLQQPQPHNGAPLGPEGLWEGPRGVHTGALTPNRALSPVPLPRTME